MNKRTFNLRRISNQIPKKEVLKVVQCIWMSKLRYGLQLCNQVPTKADDTSCKLMNQIQVAQNKMLRMMYRVTLKDHITLASLLQKYNLSSVNQLAAEIKLTKAWKATHVDSYPVQMETFNPSRVNSGRTVRPGTRKLWNDEAKTSAAKISFSKDTAKLWNNAPTDVTSASTLSGAKREIKKHCKSYVL